MIIKIKHYGAGVVMIVMAALIVWGLPSYILGLFILIFTAMMYEAECKKLSLGYHSVIGNHLGYGLAGLLALMTCAANYVFDLHARILPTNPAHGLIIVSWILYFSWLMAITAAVIRVKKRENAPVRAT